MCRHRNAPNTRDDDGDYDDDDEEDDDDDDQVDVANNVPNHDENKQQQCVNNLDFLLRYYF